MTRTYKTPLTLAAVLAIAIIGLGLNTPAEAQNLVREQGADHSPTQTAPSRQSPDSLSAGSTNTVAKKDIWGDPDAFLAKCNEAGGGASTDPDGFPHCEDSNGNNIIIPMEE